MKKEAIPELYETALFVIDNVNAMLAYCDKECICKFANAAYYYWFGKTRDEIVNKHIIELLGSKLYNQDLKYINGVLNGQMQVFEREIPLPQGGTRPGLATYTPHIVDGIVKGFFVHVADCTMLKKIEKELEIEKAKAVELATHDFLTRLPNRLTLMDRFEIAIANAKRNNESFAVMYMDLDKFKVVNDTLGHHVGDKLLKEIADRIKGAICETDTLARIGGDEFVLLSTNIKSNTDAEAVATRILECFCEPFECLGNSGIKPAVSIGIAYYPRNGKLPEKLIKSADTAMYKAKKSERNRFEFA